MSFSYAYVPIFDRPALRWPNGKRVAVILTMNVEVFPTPEIQAAYAGIPSRPAGQRNLVAEMAMEFGARVGVWRIMRWLDELGVKVSTHFNADVCTTYPSLADAIRRRGWEITAHSTNQAEPLTIFVGDPEGERAHIRRVVGIIERTFGFKPKGWVSPGAGSTEETPRLLAEEGFDWFGDWGNDDQPYWVQAGDRRILSIPYTFDVNDIIHFVRENQTAEAWVERVRDEFHTLDREGRESGRIMTIGVHPYLFGRPFRFGALVRSLEWLKEQEGAWFCHRSEIVAAYRAQVK